MTAFLTLDSVSAATPDGRPLFHDLTLAVGAERIGVVGRNGAGKSTLLHIMAGDQPASTGTVTHTGRVGTLAQDWDDSLTVAQALGVAKALAVLARVLAGNGGPDDFEHADWTLEERIAEALDTAGIPGMAPDRPIASLSGGERTRIGVARLLIEAPDLLLLDEPTNNLDSAGREAIAALVRDWRGGVVLASHDRALLETMDRIVELSPVGIRAVGGGWTAFAEMRERERDNAARTLDRARADLRDARRAAQQQREAKERRDKAGRAFAAKGSEPKILLGAKAERAENSGGRTRLLSERMVGEAEARAGVARAAVEVLTPLTIEIPSSGLPSGAQVLSLQGVSVRFADRMLGPWDLDVTGPERIAITGSNGAGKSTLLKIAAGLTAPTAGIVRRATGRVAMLDQHCSLLDPGESVLANFRRLNPGADDHVAHAACARFAFRNRDMLREAGTLSGGERLRAGLACTLGGGMPPWLLILDEPTNHLDIASLEVLEAALCRFDGALLAVSHDPAFLNAIGIERIFEVTG